MKEKDDGRSFFCFDQVFKSDERNSYQKKETCNLVTSVRSRVEVKGFRRNYKREIQGNNNNNNNNKNNVMKEVAIAHV